MSSHFLKWLNEIPFRKFIDEKFHFYLLCKIYSYNIEPSKLNHLYCFMICSFHCTRVVAYSAQCFMSTLLKWLNCCVYKPCISCSVLLCWENGMGPVYIQNSYCDFFNSTCGMLIDQWLEKLTLGVRGQIFCGIGCNNCVCFSCYQVATLSQ